MNDTTDSQSIGRTYENKYIELFNRKLIFHEVETNSVIKTKELKHVKKGKSYHIELCGDELFFYNKDKLVERMSTNVEKN